MKNFYNMLFVSNQIYDLIMKKILIFIISKKNITKLFLLSLLFIISNADNLFALNLIELQNEAVKNRKLIEKLKIQILNQDTALNIQKSEYWPKLDIEYSLNKIDKAPENPLKEYSEFETILSYSIFSGYKNYYQKLYIKTLKESKQYALDSIIQDIKFLVSADYLHIFDTKSLLKVAEDEYNLLKKRYNDAFNRHKVGMIKKNDLLKIQVEMDNASQKKEKAAAEFEKAIIDMERLVGIDIDFLKIEFEEFKQLPDIKDLVFYLTNAARRNEIKAVERQLIAMDYNLQSHKSDYYPSVEMSASYYRYDDDYLIGIGDNYQRDIKAQLSLKMNIFDGFKVSNIIKSQRNDIKALICDLDELKKDIANQVEKTFLDHEVNLKNLKVAQKSISQAEENLRTTDMSFNQGLATTADVLDAIYYLSRAKYNFIYAGGELFLNYYRLTRISDGF